MGTGKSPGQTMLASGQLSDSMQACTDEVVESREAMHSCAWACACAIANLHLCWLTVSRMCRQATALEEKLERLAGQIGQWGLVAALIALGTMSAQFTWKTLVVQGQSWQWSFLSDYLKFIITAITIVVRHPFILCSAQAWSLAADCGAS